MSATLDEIATFLVSASVGTAVGTDVFKGQLPASAPDASVVIYEYGGLEPDHVFGTAAIAVEKPRVQIVCRGAANDYATPRAMAETAYRACAAAANQTLSGTQYLILKPLQPPFLMGKDENKRCLIAFNVQIQKALS